MSLHESGENYLETILILKEKHGMVRSIDIVEELGYSKSSVSRAVNLLKDRGLITISVKGNIDFTQEGITLTKKIYERHHVLTHFLKKIGVSNEVAENDACRIEHVISDMTVEAIKSFLKEKE